jgi:predicted small lipoprotein YifL
MRASALIICIALLLAGCGQRGPLYLRDQPPPGVTARKAEPYQPVPYPADTERDAEKK